MACLAREKYFGAACTQSAGCILNFGLNKSSIDFFMEFEISKHSKIF